ncbi:MAG: hypothetical protein P4M04_13885 [Acidobacteriota bacterium]|nr:hypothetical protein [Acidobacteriota bacterium]
MADQPYSRDHFVPIDEEPRHHLVIENEFVRAFAVEIAPHDRTLCHQHNHDYLMYVAGDAEIVSVPRDDEPKKLSYRDGDCELSQAGMVHVVENRKDTPFRNIVAELLLGAGGLRRSPHPKVIGGQVTIIPAFEDDRAEVLVLHMGADSRLAVFGPALLASPYGQPIELLESDGNRGKLCGFNELKWMPASYQAILMDHTSNAARVVLIAVGNARG